ERRVVVLTGGEDVQAHILGLLGDGHHGLDPLVLGGHAAGRGVGRDVPDGEDSELHAAHPPKSMHLHRSSPGSTPKRPRYSGRAPRHRWAWGRRGGRSAPAPVCRVDPVTGARFSTTNPSTSVP